MKRFFSNFIILVFFSLFATGSVLLMPENHVCQAEESRSVYECNGFMYSLLDDGTAVIVGCEAPGISLKIPNTLDGHTVTKIADYAFESKRAIISLSLPNTLREIGNGAFCECILLSEVSIPGSVNTIGSSAFYKCERLKTVAIQNGVRTIGDRAFAFCSKLEYVSIAGSVKVIDEYAFFKCKKLKKVEIQNGVQIIRGGAFEECGELTAITLPGSIKTISNFAFMDRSSSLVCTVEKNSYAEEYCLNLKIAVNYMEKKSETDATVFNNRVDSMWYINYYVNAFNEPTDHFYMSNRNLFNGTYMFSENSTEKKLQVRFLIDYVLGNIYGANTRISIILYVDGERVTGFSDSDWAITFSYPENKEETIYGTMRSDRIIISTMHVYDLIEALSQQNTIDCRIWSMRYSMKYTFSINHNTHDFIEAYNNLRSVDSEAE